MKRTVALGIFGAMIVLAACGSSTKSSAAPAGSFRLREFTITAPRAPVHAGRVTITADNVGGEKHELVIVVASDAGALPTKADGSVDEDKIPSSDKAGEIGDVPARSRRAKTFTLAPGTYVAFCNLVDSMGNGMMGSSSAGGMMTNTSGMRSGTGHVHFALGMHVSFTVR